MTGAFDVRWTPLQEQLSRSELRVYRDGMALRRVACAMEDIQKARSSELLLLGPLPWAGSPWFYTTEV